MSNTRQDEEYMAAKPIISTPVPYKNQNKAEEERWKLMKPECEYCQEPIPLSIYLNDEYFPYCNSCVKHINYRLQ